MTVNELIVQLDLMPADADVLLNIDGAFRGLSSTAVDGSEDSFVVLYAEPTV
jgi:hypothetical protein